MNDDSNSNAHDDEQDRAYDGGVYVVDDDTLRLLEVVVGMIHMLSHTQVDEGARENCAIIAEELAERFALPLEGDIEVEEIISGDEVLYRPRGGVMGDDEPEAEGPAPDEREAL